MMSNDENDESQAARPSPQPAKKAGAGKEDWIGAHLRKVYDEALSEPVPDRFLALLKEIDKKERGS
ncbi:MAG: NepR family anti-sigma factor [Kiloniellaceae bacterium]